MNTNLASDIEAMAQAGPALTSGPSGSFPQKLRHDLRNQLNQIIGYCELVGESAEAEAATGLSGLLDELIRASSQVVERLSSFPVDCEQAIHEEHEQLQNELRSFATQAIDSAQDCQKYAKTHNACGLVADLLKIECAGMKITELAQELTATNGKPSVPDRTASMAPASKSIASVPEPAPSIVASNSLALRSLSPLSGLVLVVDDMEDNREILFRFLQREGLRVEGAGSGQEALGKLAAQEFDLILLDLMLGDVDGLTVLFELKRNPSLTHIPVVIISAIDEVSRVAACLEAGAEDYLTKPFNAVLLRSRLKVLLERKRLQDEQRRKTYDLEKALEEVDKQKKIADGLLNNILPARVALELHEKGSVDPMYFEDVTIVITDFVGFTLSTEKLSAEELVDILHTYFTAFDGITERYGLEKLKTVGDSYIFVSGMPDRSPSHPVDAVLAAFEMIEVVQKMGSKLVDWQIRIGIHTGPVIAGVVGIRKFAFDIWGDSINLASRMESSGAPNRINVSERTYARIKDFFACEPRGRVATKDKRDVEMYFANGIAASLLKPSESIFPFNRRYKIYFQKEPRAFPQHLLPSP